MWNVKRVLILFAGVAVSLIGYAVYALFLGNIDGMPLLPEELRERRTEAGKIIDERPPPPLIDEKLIQSFGANCKELHWPLRLWLADKGIAFASGDFSIEKDGKVKLAPFSAALYHKSKGPGAFPEISTIRCDVALITLDRPVSSYSELNSREVIGVEMIGKKPGITMANNRRSAEKGDDVDILITNGNLFYKKSADLIWSDGVVCLKDYQTQPPTEVRGKGFEMHLAKDNQPKNLRPNAKVQTAKPTNDNGGIERIRLHADVDMHFWVDASSGFLGGTPNTKNPVAPPKDGPRADEQTPPGKAHLHIKTGGPFVYDLSKEVAWFESPPSREHPVESLPIAPDQVHVERLQMVQGKVKFDQLICDRLDFQFRKRTSPVGPGEQAMGGDKEIETAKATRRDKNDVVLSLDSEQMAAYGTDLFYRAGDLSTGPITILKGDPLKTVKDGHKMVSKELHLYAANRAGEGQKAWARGPGQIDLIDSKDTQKPSWPTHILWNDTLTVVKVKEGGEVFDLMTVVGDASFIDDQQKQELHGEKIQTWIAQLQEGDRKPQTVGGPKQEIRRVLALQRVRAVSPDFIVRQTDRLTVTFVNKVPPSQRLPAADVVATKPAAGPGGMLSPPMSEPKAEAKAAAKKNDPPIELTAVEITAEVFTLGPKKELQELIAKGNVYVFQPGEKPGEKRIDITGQILTVHYAELGHTMVVHGDTKSLGRLEMGEMVLWGPLITINRGDNKARVDGHGAMQMPTNKNLDGTDLPKNKKASRVTIWWNKSMNFDGRNALFQGGVQAQQQDSFSKLKCENLRAYFDRFISFKEGQKDNQSAKIDRIWCDKNVYVDDTKFDERKQRTQENRLIGAHLAMDNVEGPMNVTGPGQTWVLAKGNSGLEFGPAPPPGAPQQPAKPEWKLTHVKFRDRMFSNTKSTTKNATFYGYNSGVEVFHFATTDINAKMDADRPAKDQVYLRCGVLQVEGRQTGDKTTQYMIAQQNCEFRTDKYLAYAAIVKYDESSDIVIFESTDGASVRMFEFQPDNPQPRPMSINSSKVLYNRRTGTIESMGVKSISN